MKTIYNNHIGLRFPPFFTENELNQTIIDDDNIITIIENCIKNNYYLRFIEKCRNRDEAGFSPRGYDREGYNRRRWI